MKISFNYETDLEEVLLLEEEIVHQNDLIIYNDDFNTFHHVIESLVEICKHEPTQAEQCAYIIHHKGKCGVKRGAAQDLQDMCTALLDRGLSAKIE